MSPSEGGLRLVLVRHGQTTWNAEARYQGHRDIPLSETGQLQASALGALMSGWNISAVYSSDLSRACETASRIALPHRLEVARDRRLREMCFGEWEARTHEEIESEFGEDYRAWLLTPTTMRPPGGETLLELRDRAMAALKDIVAGTRTACAAKSDRPAQHVVVVCHGGPIRTVLSTVLGLPLNRGFWDLAARPGSYAILSGDHIAWRRFSGAGSCDSIRVECLDVVPAVTER